MKTAIIYATTYGSTQKVAEELQKIITNATVFNVKKDSIDLACFDSVILGSSIYVGQIDKKLKTFVKENKESLMSKKRGFYFCCGFEENLQTYLDANVDKELVEGAVVMSLGGEMDISKMSFAHKMITRMVQKSQQGKSREVVLRLEKAEEYARQFMNQTE